ncbi:3-deoxy-D-manno-octulosonic acid transferase [Geobacter pelophilus]|uniref:3-deoxy-D-manno-octulosonic acid transferase n=1 Tax=Geoanaerobacter pelophilus TaxID=60036 RepID=A0AAW4L339_9BACT|nr:3-deoxy-D-manno-octulosonic acid transferase [Geoanaerobacter pelophilus]MBT0665554.1 3-deoxy-D-manno-octulosonic acid transferase [Geoanaerobacter pelophilus]
MYLLYNILLLLLLPVIIAWHLYRSVSRGRPAALRERFGFVPAILPPAASRPIWVHAVSVGESVACRPLLKGIKARFTATPLLISNMTETGRQVASGFPEVDLALYFPFDYPFAVRRLLRAVKPSVIVIVETELWPNFLREARLAGIPVVIANGRISDRSFRGYLRAKAFFRPVLANVSRFCMQGEEDARRIIAIGAPADLVLVSRNLKFDITASPVTVGRKEELRDKFSVPGTATVFTAGSTHDGEEGQLIAAYLDLLAAEPKLFMVLVPRHPERAAAVAELLKRHGLSYRLRSELVADSQPLQPGELLLVDTVGELMQFYELSDIVFVGGSLVSKGGHNLLEPASLGVPVLFGPHMANFREIASLVKQYDAGHEVEDAHQLVTAIRQLLNDPVRRNTMGENGIRLLSDNGGATARHMAVIESMIKGEA